MGGGTIINSGGQNLSGDLLLILAAPNLSDGWATAGSLGPSPWELDSDHDNGWAFAAGDKGGDGIFAAGDNIFSYLGLSGNNSNSFTNFQAADYAYAGSPYNATNPITQYGLSVFEFPNARLNKNLGAFIDFTLGSNVPTGTILAAFIHSSGTHANPFVNPFTEAGLDGVPSSDAVPEPGTLLLLGTGLLTFAGFMKRRLV